MAIRAQCDGVHPPGVRTHGRPAHRDQQIVNRVSIITKAAMMRRATVGSTCMEKPITGHNSYLFTYRITIDLGNNR